MANGQFSVMQHSFANVPDVHLRRSQFDRTHGYKTAFNSGYLVPCYVDEVLPGDTFSLQMAAFTRLATPIVPVMDNLFLETFFFFVPYRLIWTNARKFFGEQDNPGDSISYLMPTATSPVAGYTVGSLQDYFGLPTVGQVGGAATITHCNLPLRAYNLIWNTWFRDENLQNSVTVDMGDGPDTASNYTLLRRGKRHDYFTACLPWPQKGSTAVSLPLGTQAIVKTAASSIFTGAQNSGIYLTTSGSTPSAHPMAVNSGGGLITNTNAVGTQQDALYPSNLYADLSSATAATINQLRQSIATQQFLERDARGGTRYIEIIRSHFGVVSSDARLQRPELLGTGSTPINFTPVAQTSPTSGSNAQGALAAFATGAVSGHGFTKSFEEHGFVIGLVNVRADLSYQQGLDKMWSRSTRYDLYWPTFDGLGEQAVLNQEIYADGSANDTAVFGYQERYGEYRYKASKITGIMRSTAASTVDIWHLAQKFTSLPTLNSTFIQDTPPVNRIMAVTSQPELLFDAFFRLKCARPMPVYSVPGLERL